MELQAPDLVRKSVPVQVEGAIILIIAFIIVANTATTDIIFFDNYVLPAIEVCFPENQEEFCQKIRQRMGLQSNAQLEIGDIYWNELLRQAIFIGFILFAIRMAIGYFLMVQGIRKIRGSTIFIAVFWGLAGAGLFLFGFVDTLYFVLQGDDVPEELAWLNSAGLFQETRSFTGDPNIVEKEDLFLTNILGIFVLVSFLLIVMYVYANQKQKNRGIA